MSRFDSLPSGDDVTRVIKPSLLGRDDEGNVIVDEKGLPRAIFPSAFELRSDEDGLSINWLQCFGAEKREQIKLTAEAVRLTNKSKKLSVKTGFAVAKVSEVLKAGQDNGSKLRVVHDPIDGNRGHSEIRQYPRELSAFQEVLASETFTECYLYGDVINDGWRPMSVEGSDLPTGDE